MSKTQYIIRNKEKINDWFYDETPAKAWPFLKHEPIKNRGVINTDIPLHI